VPSYVAKGKIPSGIWLNEFSPYFVQDTIWLTSGNTLYIEYGCEIYFATNAVFYIEDGAKLVAGAPRCSGDPQDSVWFKWAIMTPDTLNGWGGLRFESAEHCTLNLCHISGVVVHDAASYGAISNVNSSLAIENCLIDGNIGGGGGGGAVFVETSHESSLLNCTITNNRSFGHGGGVYVDASNFSMGGNFINHNELRDGSYNGGGAFLKGSFNSVGDIFSWNKSLRDGGGVFTEDFTGTIERPIISFNLANRRGGGIAMSGGSPTISRGDICSNYALAIEGAGVYTQDNSAPTFVNCVIAYNDGGGIWGTSTAGGGDNIKIINSTIAKNFSGPGLRFGWIYGGADVLLFNSAVFRNTASHAPCQQITLSNASNLYVSHSYICNSAQVCLDLIANLHHIEPADFITGDPAFADTMECNVGWIPSCAPSMSVLIDAGAPSVDFLSETVFAPDHDFLGNDRFMDLGWDIGAFENSCLGMRDRGDLPQTSSLIAVRPNPFNAAMSIEFELLKASEVTIEIFDMSGRKADEIHVGGLKSGFHRVDWSAGDRPSGVYTIKLDAGSEVFTTKATLVK